MAIVVQKYGGSSVADADKLRIGRRARDRPRASSATMSWSWSPRWETRPTICWRWRRKSRRIPIAASSTCCSRPANASRWRCSRWRFANSAATRSVLPAASPASSPTIGTLTRASSRCGRFASRTSSRAGKSSSSPDTRASRTRKEVTTLGRGGSDTTAVAMAAALDAEYCEICSDVDGVYSADPRVVSAAARIGTLSYEETQEMAEAGAKVLNAQAVEFAKEKGIAIYARATEGPLPGPTRRATERSSAAVRRGCPAPSSASPAKRTSSCSTARARRANCLTVLAERRVPGNSFTSSATAPPS